jgi:hypothetical protein
VSFNTAPAKPKAVTPAQPSRAVKETRVESNMKKVSGDKTETTKPPLKLDLQFFGSKDSTKAADNVPSSLLKGPSNTHVYYGIKNGEINYVGITKNPIKRAAQHGERFDRLDILTEEPLTRRQARAIEQVLINRNSNLSNKINSISPKQIWYKKAVEWGEAWLKERGY